MHTQWLLFLVSAAADLRVGQINLRYSFTISRVLHLVVVSIFLRCWCGFGITGLLANLVASQFGECGVHLVGQGLVPVLVDAQLVCGVQMVVGNALENIQKYGFSTLELKRKTLKLYTMCAKFMELLIRISGALFWQAFLSFDLLG